MKKIITFSVAMIVLAIGIFAACRNENQDISKVNTDVQKLVNSKTFAGHSDFIKNFGEIDATKIVTNKIKVENQEFNVFLIPVTKNDKVVARIEVIDLKDTKFLPNNDKYAMNLADLSNFNEKTLTGSVKMYDLNYDNYLHTEINIEQNKIKDFNSRGISNQITEKYKSSRNPNKSRNLTSRHLCDGNGNGDVSFGECYKCLKDAIADDGFSSWVCDIPAAGWLACWGTTTAACVIISANA
ncbi:hypothetical protein [Bergeyella sp. RCAD1439]|uniref:hypothetical protein n=1 Tax=Bergeyella anatis TaxID=3113737 RepID=UPI002E18A24A|nr:hypothetical protein [Bergeyella sp. RCAD1439]